MEKKEAHRKYVARVLGKQALAGLKINTLRQLKDQGMLIDPTQ